MKRLILPLLFLAASSMTMAAPPPPPEGGLPPGKWWRRPEIVERLQLSGEQQTRLDQAFKQHATQLVDLKGEVEKSSIELRNELDDATPRRGEVQKLAARVSEARARLFERELMMLLDMRGVLTADQWTRVRQVLDRQGDGPRRGDAGMRPGPGPRQGPGSRGPRPPGNSKRPRP